MSEEQLQKTLEQIKKSTEAAERNSLLAAKNVLTVQDVALLTNLSVSYIYRLTSTNQIPYYKRGGKMIYFKRGEIEDWLLKNRVSTQAEAEQDAIRYEINKKNKKGNKK